MSRKWVWKPTIASLADMPIWIAVGTTLRMKGKWGRWEREERRMGRRRRNREMEARYDASILWILECWWIVCLYLLFFLCRWGSDAVLSTGGQGKVADRNGSFYLNYTHIWGKMIAWSLNHVTLPIRNVFSLSGWVLFNKFYEDNPYSGRVEVTFGSFHIGMQI